MVFWDLKYEYGMVFLFVAWDREHFYDVAVASAQGSKTQWSVTRGCFRKELRVNISSEKESANNTHRHL